MSASLSREELVKTLEDTKRARQEALIRVDATYSGSIQSLENLIAMIDQKEENNNGTDKPKESVSAKADPSGPVDK